MKGILENKEIDNYVLKLRNVTTNLTADRLRTIITSDSQEK